ncbi:chromate transporter-domain-containing protein [Cenococcum geophilum]
MPSVAAVLNHPHPTETKGVSPNTEDDELTYLNAPKLSLLRLFWYFFYNFEQIVIKEKWITLTRLKAAKLCIFFSCLSASRVRGIVAGLAFILPGFILILAASYLYTLAGLKNKYFNASFRALQPIIAAIMFKATHKIADHSVIKHGTKKVDPFLIIAAICTAINSTLRLNIIAKTPSLINLFVLGLITGTLLFGGAYTAIPFIQVKAVLKVFINYITIRNVLPAPLVIFTTFIRFQGGNINGGLSKAFTRAVVITLGIFFPCFLFTIAGYSLLKKLVHNKFLSSFFNRLYGAVIGVIADFQIKLVEVAIAKAAQSGIAAVLFTVALAVLYRFTNKWVTIVLVAARAVAGQFLFLDKLSGH